MKYVDIQWLQISKNELNLQRNVNVNVNVQFVQMSDVRLRVKCTAQSGIKWNFTVDR